MSIGNSDRKMASAESPNGSSAPSPTHSRASSVNTSRSGHQHAPSQPSGLRNSHMPPSSPDDKKQMNSSFSSTSSVETSIRLPEFEQDGIHPTIPQYADVVSDEPETHQKGITDSGISGQADVRTRLLDQNYRDRTSGYGSNSNGSTANRPKLGRNYDSISTIASHEGFGGRHLGDEANGDATTVVDRHGNGKKLSITQWLAKRHGVKNPHVM